MARSTAQKKTKIPIPVIVAIISLIGVCVTVAGGIVTGIIPNFFDSLKSEPSESLNTFRVTEINGSSISQAKVILVSGTSVFTEYTDSNGVATFTVQTDGEKRVFVETNQYEIYDQIIPEGSNSVIEIRLKPKDFNKRSVIIRVFDSNKKIPINGAEVVLIANGNVYSQIADSNGITKFYMAFQTDEIDGDISVSFNGYEIEHQRVTLQANYVQDISLDTVNGTVSIEKLSQVLPQATLASSTSTPTSSALSELSPEAFVTNYFETVNSKNYEVSYSMLSDGIHKSLSFNDYTSFWDTVEKVEILSITIESQSTSEVVVYVEAHYYYKSGAITTGHTKYRLIKDGVSWILDSY